MRTADEVARKILERAVFTPDQIDRFSNWNDIPKPVAHKLSQKIREEAALELGQYAREVALAYLGRPMTHKLITFKLPDEPIKLAFDPTAPVKPGLDRERRIEANRVRRIFKSAVARNLWLGIKPGFITSQHFVPDIMFFAARIHKKKPTHWLDLYKIIRCGRDPIFDWMGGSSYLQMAEVSILLLPYVTGHANFRWEFSPTAHKEPIGA